ncbi:hypothetical protein Moror_2634 [Moniliophthora roreri MCA 2997]|uniref:Uncharacterized protein n=1 Tax=Moniliophthora roreri (strain MCA 2997) TaxID=1381753 RepID=V2XCQ7_MONRO|nr:hypothetical protein Moror_2634 [Moniliophthora roreri MCA 2997]
MLLCRPRISRRIHHSGYPWNSSLFFGFCLASNPPVRAGIKRLDGEPNRSIRSLCSKLKTSAMPSILSCIEGSVVEPKDEEAGRIRCGFDDSRRFVFLIPWIITECMAVTPARFT